MNFPRLTKISIFKENEKEEAENNKHERTKNTCNVGRKMRVKKKIRKRERNHKCDDGAEKRRGKREKENSNQWREGRGPILLPVVSKKWVFTMQQEGRLMELRERGKQRVRERKKWEMGKRGKASSK